MEQKLKNLASQLPETQLELDTIAAVRREIKPRFSPTWRPAAILAVCLVLLASFGLGTYAYAQEAKEYKAAVEFFNDNGLSTEGLTRGEIRRVYRDIKTESFSYSKTAEVIRSSLTHQQVGGYEIWQAEPSQEDIKNLWNDKNYNGRFVPFVPAAYQFDVNMISDETGLVVETEYYLIKCKDGAAVWRTRLPFFDGKYYEVADGVLVCGSKTTYHNRIPTTEAWVGKLDHNGTILWLHKLDNGFGREYPVAILVNADGSCTLFSNGNTDFLCISRYTPEGERTLYKQTKLGTHSVCHAASFGDGYLLQLYGQEEDEFARFIRLDSQGNVLDGFSYKDAKSNYVLRDMVEWGGRVYVSAYAFPKLGEKTPTSAREEIDGVLDFAFAQDGIDIPTEVLTPVVRDNYAAVLLVCDPKEGGKLQVCYTVPGSLGADLIFREDGHLVWETENITTTFFSPLTNFFTIGGVCYIDQYVFDGDGVLMERGNTGKTVNFRR